MKQRTYLAIDLKSFYASVECRERGLDPLNTNLVVADESRTDQDDLPCRHADTQELWHLRPRAAVRGAAARPRGQCLAARPARRAER